jgi:hypothetical protein
MSYERLAYDDVDTAAKMHEDCAACGESLTLPRQRTVRVFPDLRKDTKPPIEVSDAAAYLASRLHLD